LDAVASPAIHFPLSGGGGWVEAGADACRAGRSEAGRAGGVPLHDERVGVGEWARAADAFVGGFVADEAGGGVAVVGVGAVGAVLACGGDVFALALAEGEGVHLDAGEGRGAGDGGGGRGGTGSDAGGVERGDATGERRLPCHCVAEGVGEGAGTAGAGVVGCVAD